MSERRVSKLRETIEDSELNEHSFKDDDTKYGITLACLLALLHTCIRQDKSA